MSNIFGKDRACDGCHMRMLCPDCLPHSKHEALTRPDRPVPPVIELAEAA